MHQHLPVAGTSPISPGARLGWKPLLSLMLSASSSSMNEFLQQISSSTWLQAKRQVSKGDWSYDRMSECLRQRTHWGNRDGKPLNVMTKSATFVTKKVQICGQKKKRWADNFHITSLLSFGQNNVSAHISPHLPDWRGIHTFLAVRAAVPQDTMNLLPRAVCMDTLNCDFAHLTDSSFIRLDPW